MAPSSESARVSCYSTFREKMGDNLDFSCSTIATHARLPQPNSFIAPHAFPHNSCNASHDENTEGDANDELTSEAIEARRKAKGKSRAVEVEDEQPEERTTSDLEQTHSSYQATSGLIWDTFLETILKHALNIIKEKKGLYFDRSCRAIWESFLQIVMNNILAGFGQIPPNGHVQFDFSPLWQGKLSIMEPEVTDPQMFTAFVNGKATWVRAPARTSSVYYPVDHPYMSRSRRLTMKDLYWHLLLLVGSVQQPDGQEVRRQDLGVNSLPLGSRSTSPPHKTAIQGQNEPVVFGNLAAHQALAFNAPNAIPASNAAPSRTLTSTALRSLGIEIRAPTATAPTVQTQRPSSAPSSSTQAVGGHDSDHCTFIHTIFDANGRQTTQVSTASEDAPSLTQDLPPTPESLSSVSPPTPSASTARKRARVSFECEWVNEDNTTCTDSFPTMEAAAAHARTSHANKNHNRKYDCRWQGCRNNSGTGLASLAGLERHVLTHLRQVSSELDFEEPENPHKAKKARK